jgi:hypothetical protein
LASPKKLCPLRGQSSKKKGLCPRIQKWICRFAHISSLSICDKLNAIDDARIEHLTEVVGG